MAYTPEQLETARELIETLESFNNKYLAIAANTRSVSDKTRSQVISGILVEEFGMEIFSTRVFNPFGNDNICAVTNYKDANA